ncbi:MAG: hypothetical protein RBT49_08820 [Bacteroidales bacterium]|jgi:hypothetical protein|nr:hypothetical protein [Bacteroidales bacterium]
MKVYMVMKMNSDILVDGQITPFPEGKFFIPVFVDYNEAVEHSDGKFEIVEAEVNFNNKNVDEGKEE